MIRILFLAATAAAPLPPLKTLTGHWRIAAIDDHAIDGSLRLALRADRGRVWWEPSCAGFERYYRIIGVRFSTSGYRKGEAPPLICLIAPPREIADAFVALTAGSRVVRTPDNGVKITGGGHSLLLFSQ